MDRDQQREDADVMATSEEEDEERDPEDEEDEEERGAPPSRCSEDGVGVRR